MAQPQIQAASITISFALPFASHSAAGQSRILGLKSKVDEKVTGGRRPS